MQRAVIISNGTLAEVPGSAVLEEQINPFLVRRFGGKRPIRLGGYAIDTTFNGTIHETSSFLLCISGHTEEAIRRGCMFRADGVHRQAGAAHIDGSW